MRWRLWPLKRADDIFRALDRNEISVYPGSVTHLRISRFVEGAPGAGLGRRCGLVRIARRVRKTNGQVLCAGLASTFKASFRGSEAPSRSHYTSGADAAIR
jgi:hypothetical protein